MLTLKFVHWKKIWFQKKKKYCDGKDFSFNLLTENIITIQIVLNILGCILFVFSFRGFHSLWIELLIFLRGSITIFMCNLNCMKIWIFFFLNLWGSSVKLPDLKYVGCNGDFSFLFLRVFCVTQYNLDWSWYCWIRVNSFFPAADMCKHHRCYLT